MKIVVFLKNWIGDTFFQFPAIRLIKQKHPGAEITCIAPPRCRELLSANPDISNVIEFDEKTTQRSWFKRFAFVRELRAKGPWEQAYLLHRSRSRAMLLAFAGVKARFGYGKRRSFWLTRAVAEPAQPMHHVDYFLELLRGLGYSVPEQAYYELPVSDQALEESDRLLKEAGIAGQKHFVCFHLGANWMPKRWPPGYFAHLADLIHDQWQVPIVVTGSQVDTELWEKMNNTVLKARVISLVGKTDLNTLAALYSQTAFVVSGDSGPMHIAAAVGARVVALFGPTAPDLTGPRGSGEKIVLKFSPAGVEIPFMGEASRAKDWLAQISPKMVLDAVQKQGWLA